MACGICSDPAENQITNGRKNVKNTGQLFSKKLTRVSLSKKVALCGLFCYTKDR